MINIMQELSTERITACIEANLYAWLPVLGLVGRVTETDPPGVKRVISDIPLALFNSIMDTHLNDEDVDNAIKVVQADADQRKIPALWWVGPSTRPALLGQKLLEAGFTVDEESPGMAVNLDQLNEDFPIHEGLSIQQVEDNASLWSWCKTCPVGFGAVGDRVDRVAESWHTLLSRVDSAVATAYIAWLDEKSVATSLLLYGAGVAGIYAVTTLPEARRKGIGARVTLQPLIDARRRGFKLGILQSSEMGVGVYSSLGFKEYCRICSYVYLP